MLEYIGLKFIEEKLASNRELNLKLEVDTLVEKFSKITKDIFHLIRKDQLGNFFINLRALETNKVLPQNLAIISFKERCFTATVKIERAYSDFIEKEIPEKDRLLEKYVYLEMQKSILNLSSIMRNPFNRDSIDISETEIYFQKCIEMVEIIKGEGQTSDEYLSSVDIINEVFYYVEKSCLENNELLLLIDYQKRISVNKPLNSIIAIHFEHLSKIIQKAREKILLYRSYKGQITEESKRYIEFLNSIKNRIHRGETCFLEARQTIVKLLENKEYEFAFILIEGSFNYIMSAEVGAATYLKNGNNPNQDIIQKEKVSKDVIYGTVLDIVTQINEFLKLYFKILKLSPEVKKETLDYIKRESPYTMLQYSNLSLFYSKELLKFLPFVEFPDPDEKQYQEKGVREFIVYHQDLLNKIDGSDWPENIDDNEPPNYFGKGVGKPKSPSPTPVLQS